MSQMLSDLINDMQILIGDAKNVLLMPDKCMINREEIDEIIQKILQNMPADLELARDIVDKRNLILSEAQAQSDEIIEKAEKKAETLLDEQEIIRLARIEAEEILLNARTKSAEIKKMSTNFCNESLQKIEENIAGVFEDVKDIRKKFNFK